MKHFINWSFIQLVLPWIHGRFLRIRDLLSKNPKQKLDLKDHPDGGVYVKDLTIMIVKGVRDLQQVMEVPGGGSERLVFIASLPKIVSKKTSEKKPHCNMYFACFPVLY